MNTIELNTKELAEVIVNNVYHDKRKKEYRREYKDQYLYTIYKGQKQMYSHDETMPGVTVYFKAHYGPETTIVYCDNLKRAYEIVAYQEQNRDSIKDAQQKLGDYIRKNKMY